MSDKESLTMKTDPKLYNEKIEVNKARIKALLAAINKLKEENKRFKKKKKITINSL